MKIVQMNLLAFGPFTDLNFDFGAGKEGLHIIYGQNEAGKSSALQAIHQMFYGIDLQSSYDFLHPYTKMRIGAKLQHSDGSELGFVRRKGKINTLRAEDDEALLDESLLNRFLGGVNADIFNSIFGISHDELIRGGKEIIRGGGNIGEALFAAGSGISDLHKVQSELKEEAELLFKPSGKKPAINSGISSLKRNQKEIRDSQLPGQEWEKHDQALREAKERIISIEHHLGQSQRERHRLERINEALPAIAQRKELIEDLKSYHDTVILPADFGDRRRALLTNLRIAKNEEDQALQNIKGIETALNGLEVSEQIIENEELIEKLYQELGGHEKATKDSSKLSILRNNLQREASDILFGLRNDLTLDEAEKLQLKKTEIIRIQELGIQYEGLITRLKDSRNDSDKLSRHIDRLNKDYNKIEEQRDIGELKIIVDRALKQGPVEDQYNSECSEIKTAISSAETALSKQTLWSGTLEVLEKLPIPPLETIDKFEHLLDQAQSAITSLQGDINQVEDSLLDNKGRIEQLRLEQEVPTEQDLQDARQKRDQGWEFIRKSWEEKCEPDSHSQDFISAFPSAGTLAEAYELSVNKADDIADRLRREADRVANKAGLLAEQEKFGTKLKHLKTQLEEADTLLSESNKEWTELWRPIEIDPRTPKEMRVWVQDQMRLAEQYSEIQQRKSKTDDLKTRIKKYRQELESCLKSLAEPTGGEDITLSDLIDRAGKVVDRQEKIKNDRQQILREKSQREDELKESQFRVEGAEEELAKWQHQWAEAVQPLGLENNASPGQANAVIDDLKELFNKLKEADILHKRIKGIGRDAEKFSENVLNLVKHITEDLAELSAEQAAAELNAKLKSALAAKTQQEGFEKQKKQEEEQLKAARNKISEINSQLEIMCEEAGCSNSEEFPDAEARSKHRQKTERELKDLEDQLHKLSAGATIEEFIADARTIDPDDIESQVNRLNDAIEQQTKEKSELDQTIGSERTELSKMDGSALAADLAVEGQMLLARLETNVQQYAKLRIASAILKQSIERFREKNQGPVLIRANKLFADLTLGSFEGIRAEFDQHGNAILVGVRPGGKEIVEVERMSDGTTDQLYLALRLASLETYLEKNEPIPFIVDDILIRFDDERAAATLKILGQLSNQTQIIFFTHHQRLVELAEDNVEPSILFKYSLSS